GEVRLTLADGSKVVAEAADGFLSVENDTITIVARKAALV
ncbi:MAG: F0F1 ATP synthase subunit epsilon, partial [Cryobacterium sp.]